MSIQFDDSYRFAATRGRTTPQADGRGVARDERRAFAGFRKAAEQGENLKDLGLD